MFGIRRFNVGGCKDFWDSITEKYPINHALYLPPKVQIYTNKRIRVRVEDTRNHNEDNLHCIKIYVCKALFQKLSFRL